MSRWIAYQIQEDSRLPLVSCVYVFYVDGVIAYVGSTKNFAKRYTVVDFAIKDRVRQGRSFDFVSQSVSVKVKPSKKYGDWLMYEARLIRRIGPPMNRVGISGKELLRRVIETPKPKATRKAVTPATRLLRSYDQKRGEALLKRYSVDANMSTRQQQRIEYWIRRDAETKRASAR